MTGRNAESILKKEDEDRIRDHLRREGWDEFDVCDVFNTINDEFEIDPEAGAWLLELHLEGGSEGEPLTKPRKNDDDDCNEVHHKHRRGLRD